MSKKLVCSVFLLSTLLLAGTAQAQDCDCTASIDGPKQGVHSKDLADGDTIHAVLWPPNHKLQEVMISATDSNGEPCDVEIITVTQDEAIDMPGSGNTTGADAANCSNDGDASTIDLRAERSGLGDGRYYDIEFEMTDNNLALQGTCTDQHAIVLVPHDQRREQSWTNSGAILPSGALCAPGGM